jgi:hypothetical protein
MRLVGEASLPLISRPSIDPIEQRHYHNQRPALRKSAGKLRFAIEPRLQSCELLRSLVGVGQGNDRRLGEALRPQEQAFAVHTVEHRPADLLNRVAAFNCACSRFRRIRYHFDSPRRALIDCSYDRPQQLPLGRETLPPRLSTRGIQLPFRCARLLRAKGIRVEPTANPLDHLRGQIAVESQRRRSG